MLCLVAVIMVIGFIANIIINFFYLKKRIQQRGKGMFGTKEQRSRHSGNAASSDTVRGRQPGRKKKIIPQDEGEYIDFKEI